MAKKEAAAAPALSAELLALVAERAELQKWLAIAVPRELEIRGTLAAALFPNPTEGSNRAVMADGFTFVLDHKINRNLDEAALDTVMLQLPEDCPARTPGVLIDYKPKLVLGGYRNLPADQLKIVQQAVTEAPGTPALVITYEAVAGDPSAGEPAEQVAAKTLAIKADEAKASPKKKAKPAKAAAKPTKKKK